ncbi:MAG: hypothetical protein WDZ44_01715, partial [Candidatus Spechtbacterales bacterium]
MPAENGGISRGFSMPRRRGVFWRSLMNEETVDLRSLVARKAAQSSARLAKATIKEEDVPIRLSASRSEAATLRTLASLPPEALQGDEETTEEQLLEYAEALQFSSRKEKSIQETRVAVASAPVLPPVPVSATPESRIENGESSSQELVRELARIEEEDEALEQSITVPEIERRAPEILPEPVFPQDESESA